MRLISTQLKRAQGRAYTSRWLITGQLWLMILIAISSCGPTVVQVPAPKERAQTPSTPPARDATADAMGPKLVQRGDMGSPSSPTTLEDSAPDIPEPSSRVYTVAVISDLNGSYGSTTYQDEVHQGIAWITQALRPDLVISTGDMVAGQKAGLDHEAMWDAFHKAVTQPLTQANIPLAPTPGNHDASGYAAFEAERELYIEQWDKHRPQVSFVEDTYYPLQYAFTLGPALLISLDDTQVGPLGGPQMRWLEDVLQQHADKPIKIIYGHLPLYAFAQGREDEVIDDPRLEALLVDYGVTMFVSGHHHAYYPGRRGQLRLVSTACMGSGPRRLISDTQRSERSVLVFHYSEEGLLGLDAYAISPGQPIIERATLPRSLEHEGKIIVRDDL